jgi:hypothetical protein
MVVLGQFSNEVGRHDGENGLLSLSCQSSGRSQPTKDPDFIPRMHIKLVRQSPTTYSEAIIELGGNCRDRP